MPTPEPPTGGGRWGRLLLGAGLAVADQVGAVLDEAEARLERDDRGPAALRDRTARADHDDAPADRTVVPLNGRVAEPEPTLRHILIGAAVEAGERAADLAAGAGHLVGAAANVVAPMTRWAWRAPMLDPVRHRTDAAVARLAERGRLEEAAGRRQAHATFGAVVGSVSSSVVIDDVIGDVLDRNLTAILDSALPTALDGLGAKPELLVPLVESIVGEVLTPILDTAIPSVMGDLQAKPELIIPLVEAIVGKALQPILDQALPLVMDDIASQPDLIMPLVMGIVDEALEPLLQAALPRVIDVLNEDPDAIRSLVRDQSTGIAAEMTETVRFKAADADDRIDRIVRRVLRRKPSSAPPIDPPAHVVHPALPAGEPRLEALPSSSVSVAPPADPAPTGDVVDRVETARRDGHPSVDPDGKDAP